MNVATISDVDYDASGLFSYRAARNAMMNDRHAHRSRLRKRYGGACWRAALICVVFASGATLAAADGTDEKTAKTPSRDTLVVAAVTCEIKIRDTQHNLRQIAHWAEKAAAADADLVLFPECSIHGWWQSRENRRDAETLDGESLAKVRQIAKRHDLILAVGMTERRPADEAKDDGKDVADDNTKSGKPRATYHLTHVLVGPDGVIGYHRKSALAGGPRGEGAVWDAGNDANVFDVAGMRVGVAICFESVHPETCRKLKAAGAELILAPYANGTRPSEILDPQHKQRPWIWDRVRENQVWYIACDATPHDKHGGLESGAAFAIDPTGKLVACTAADNAGEAMIVVRVPKGR